MSALEELPPELRAQLIAAVDELKVADRVAQAALTKLRGVQSRIEDFHTSAGVDYSKLQLILDGVA